MWLHCHIDLFSHDLGPILLGQEPPKPSKTSKPLESERASKGKDALEAKEAVKKKERKAADGR